MLYVLLVALLGLKNVYAFDRCQSLFTSEKLTVSNNYFVQTKAKESLLNLKIQKIKNHLKQPAHFIKSPDGLKRINYNLNLSAVSLGIKKTLLDSFELLNNADNFSSFISRLYVATANRLKKSPDASENQKFNSLDINIDDLAVTLLLSENKKGRQVYLLQSNDKEEFRYALQSSPFIDLAMLNTRHGAYSHLIQYAYVKHLFAKNKIDVNAFFDFVSSKDGLRVWNLLFDSNVEQNYMSPEYLSNAITHSISDI